MNSHITKKSIYFLRTRQWEIHGMGVKTHDIEINSMLQVVCKYFSDFQFHVLICEK